MTSEMLKRAELLKRKVKTSSVSNADRDGIRVHTNPDLKSLMEGSRGYPDFAFPLEIGLWELARDYRGFGYTALAVLPLSTQRRIDKELIGKLGLTENDAVMAVIFQGENPRDKTYPLRLDAYVAMSLEDARQLIDQTETDPTIIYDLIRAANEGKPIINNENGIPVSVQPGKNVIILPNQTFGGDIAQRIESIPFPPNFTPNTIF